MRVRTRADSASAASVLRAESGFAMVAVLGICALLTTVAVAGWALARQSLYESERTKQSSQAFQAANGAMSVAITRVAVSGFKADEFPMVFTRAQLGSGDASVTVSQSAAGDYLFVSRGAAIDGSHETVRIRMYMMDLYGMNIAYGSGFNQNSSGRFNGNASIYGPFYTYEDLRQGDNVGESMAGGLGWGPVYIKGGTLDVKSGYLVDVGRLYVDPAQPDPKVVTPPTQVIRSVPNIKVPRVDAAYLTHAYGSAQAESSDNVQGDPAVRTVTNGEVTSLGNPDTYTSSRCPGASSYYKLVDNDTSLNGSLAGGLTIGGPTSFGAPENDFAWNATTRVLTVWGTVFVDGPLTLTGGPMTYVGSGSIIVNGDINVSDNFTPQGGLLAGVCGDGVTRANQTFDPGKIVGLVSPGTIRLFSSTTSNARNPDGAPTHAGAFFADQAITIDSKVMLVGSLISQGIDVTGNNNMDLRTSPNLGENIPKSMPGYGNLSSSIAVWARE